jgi:glycosyltransferase involved in cell wall biosynthesis
LAKGQSQRLAIDVTGLAWQYRTGIQNLYWAFIEAASSRKGEGPDDWQIGFYDRSGIFNGEIAKIAGQHYRSPVPKWCPTFTKRIFRFAIKNGVVRTGDLDGCVNHVWNWDIYNPRGAKASITIPDILPLEYPEWFESSFVDRTRTSLEFAARQAQFVFCISEYVKTRVAEITGMQPARIHVAYPAISEAYLYQASSSERKCTLQKYGLEDRAFLLSAGFIDPRKNLKRQLEAFSIYVQRHGTNLTYVMTGLRTAMSEEILDLVQKPHLRDRVVFLGYVSFEDLRILTQAALCVMYCSIAEGFGLPIIEAMASGTAVITSDTTSMAELGKSRARLVDPKNTEEIAGAIREMIELPGPARTTMLEQNRQYARRFTSANWLNAHLGKMHD